MKRKLILSLVVSLLITQFTAMTVFAEENDISTDSIEDISIISEDAVNNTDELLPGENASADELTLETYEDVEAEAGSQPSIQSEQNSDNLADMCGLPDFVLPTPSIVHIENAEGGIKLTIEDTPEAASFNIERSIDNKTWEYIGSCNGNGGGVIVYPCTPIIPVYTDKNVHVNTKYWYRVKYMTDWGLASEYSKVRSITYKEDIVEPKKISINTSKIERFAGEFARFTVKISPINAKSDYTLKSSNKKVVKVSKSGYIECLKAGKATITATTYNGLTAKFKVVVKERVKVNKIKLNKTSSTIKVGEKIKLHADIFPENAYDKDVMWDTSNENVHIENVYINNCNWPQEVWIVGDKPGISIITAESFDGGFTATCNITVLPYPAKSIKLDKTKIVLKKGETAILKATVAPKKANNNLKWRSSDKKTVKVNSKGKITALKTGKATITVTTADGKKKASCKVIVKKK